MTTHWIVTHNFEPWKDEMAWMALYFSLAVWASLGLGGFGLVRHRVLAHRVPGHRVRPHQVGAKPARRPAARTMRVARN